MLVVFERRTGEPVMFHMAFKAGYTHDIVLHLGLVMVTPAHQGRHLQRLCMVNMALACLSYYTLGYIMTDIAASPSATKQVGDHMVDCFPNYRHSNSPGAGGGLPGASVRLRDPLSLLVTTHCNMTRDPPHSHPA